MLKSFWRGALPLAGAAMVVMGSLVPVDARAQEIIGPDAAACRAGANGPAALVRVYGFKDRGGTLRVQAYGSDPEEFLEKGKKLKRIEVPVSETGDMNVCVALPRYGNYAIAVRHDRNGDRKSGWSDGGGFSGNPKLSLANLKPAYDDVVFTARPGVTVVDVIMNYRSGLSIKPLVARR